MTTHADGDQSGGWWVEGQWAGEEAVREDVQGCDPALEFRGVTAGDLGKGRSLLRLCGNLQGSQNQKFN